jgi:hypothetical protein
MSKWFGTDIEAEEYNPWQEPPIVRADGLDPEFESTIDEFELSPYSRAPVDPTGQKEYTFEIYSAPTTAGYTDDKLVRFYRPGVNIISGYTYGIPLRLKS